MDSDLIRGNVDSIILKCLGNGELYGNEISNMVEVASEGTYQLKKPTLYSALKRLEKYELVTKRTEQSPIGGERHYYQLTELGREVLTSKKFDWVYSKILIDNLVLDKKIVKEDIIAEETEQVAPTPTPTPEPEFNFNNTTTEAASAVSNFFDNTPINNASAVAVAVAEVEVPVPEPIVYGKGEYITVPLMHSQIGIDMNKVETMVKLRPFVKHADEKKSGKFVLYNRLRLTASAIVSLVLIGMITVCYGLLKPNNYTTGEMNFFMIGGVCIATYMLSALVLFSAYPKYKQVVTNKTQGLARRTVLSVAIAVTAICVNIIAGLSSINAMDFLVYSIVPCIIGMVFVLEGLAIMALKRVSYFLT